MRNSFERIILFLILLLVIVVIIILVRCPCSKTSQCPPAGPYPHVPFDSTKLVVWIDPSLDHQLLVKYIDDIKNKYGPITEELVCKDCDSSLVLLRGVGIPNFIQTQCTSSPNTQKCPPGGGGGGIYWSADFPVSFVYPKLEGDSTIKDSIPPPGAARTKPEVVVAVFDTGDSLANLLSGHFYTAPGGRACMGPAGDDGWNFAYDNDNWTDDYNGSLCYHHGTVVSGFIVNQEREYADGNPIRILPVKIHDASGESDLYKVLCGLAYAQKMGANIVNASFGFYAPRYNGGGQGPDPDVSITLLKAYIKYYLTDHKIIMVAAAGNEDNANEQYAYPSMDPIGKRNLDSVSFYPASLASDPEMWNVIAATTVNTREVCPKQNFSPHVVDIGVYADRNDFYFQNTIQTDSTVIGTSFATPIVAGKIAANYSKILGVLGSANPTKGALWGALGTGPGPGDITQTLPAVFGSSLVDGRVTHKHAQ